MGNPEGKSYREIIGRGIDCPPAFREAGARLELMDEQGIDFAIMLPTLASLVEERMRDDPDLCAAAIHALNRWMLEAWPYAYEGAGLLHAHHHARGARTRPSRSWTS